VAGDAVNNVTQVIPVLSSWIRRRERRRLLAAMRGYRRCREGHRLGEVTALKHALTTMLLSAPAEPGSAFVFGGTAEHVGGAATQYLLVRLAGLRFNRALLACWSQAEDRPLMAPLPPAWQRILSKHGVKVASIRCSLAWGGFVLLAGMRGVARTCVLVLRELAAQLRPSLRLPESYSHFEGLSAGNLPIDDPAGASPCIVNWYLRWPDRARPLAGVTHSVAGAQPSRVGDMEVLRLDSAIPALPGLRPALRFAAWAFGAVMLSVMRMCGGRWQEVVLLSEAAQAARARLQNPRRLARDYLFHNSNHLYRPLWTYEVEARGARILFYFYSTNCESFKRVDGYPLQANSWEAMTWPNYLVWDREQQEFVRRAVGRQPHVQVVGPIWFESRSREVPPLPAPAVAVFDVTPVRASFYQMLGIELEYYVPSSCIPFLRDIRAVCAARGVAIAWKRKRKLARKSLAHPAYRRFEDQFAALSHVVVVDPSVAAVDVIESCVATISAPFTSTALIARARGRPSCYYDPTHLVQKDDRAAHGIPIVQGKAELENWLVDALTGRTSIAGARIDEQL
jgi:polysaccharide biosynthesis PFTS motif protein